VQGANGSTVALENLREHARLPRRLLVVLLLIVLAAGAAPPAGRMNFALEVVPGLVEVAVLAWLWRRLPLSHWVCGGVFVHVLVLTYGGYYTYALAPLGKLFMQVFGFTRNHYDRVGHLALGFFPCFLTREVLLRRTPLKRGGWLVFLVLSVVLALGAFWELIEWWVTLLVAGDVGQAFLGSQGDPWDAQWDMFLALVGAALGLAFFQARHDRSLARVPGD
jgi:putative membrane protein